jgi:hypothetical protein
MYGCRRSGTTWSLSLYKTWLLASLLSSLSIKRLRGVVSKKKKSNQMNCENPSWSTCFYEHNTMPSTFDCHSLITKIRWDDLSHRPRKYTNNHSTGLSHSIRKRTLQSYLPGRGKMRIESPMGLVTLLCRYEPAIFRS